MFTHMDWVAYLQGQYGCSSPSTKVLHVLYLIQTCSTYITIGLPTRLVSFDVTLFIDYFNMDLPRS